MLRYCFFLLIVFLGCKEKKIANVFYMPAEYVEQEGHTDEFLRFINDTTVLLAWIEEEELGKHPFHQQLAYHA